MLVIIIFLAAPNTNPMPSYSPHTPLLLHIPYSPYSPLLPPFPPQGAYDKNTIYKQSDIKNILNYSRLRGIRVIPEFDTPGHTYSWGYGVNHLLVECHQDGNPTGTFGPINPTLVKPLLLIFFLYLFIIDFLIYHYIIRS